LGQQDGLEEEQIEDYNDDILAKSASKELPLELCCEFRTQISNFTSMKFRFVEQISMTTNNQLK